MKRELEIPPAAEEDPTAFEIVRVWGAKREQHVTIFWDLWEDPATWGIMRADLAGHVANAYHQQRGLARGEVLSEIRTMFNKEMQAPTDAPEGKVMSKRHPHRRRVK